MKLFERGIGGTGKPLKGRRGFVFEHQTAHLSLLNKEIQTDIALSVDVPSRIATLLSEGELDVGLIPIIEYFRANPVGTNYRILPDMAIASPGSVQSIQLFSRVPIQEIRRIALDTSSRTSVALLKVLLAEKYGISPAFTTCAPTVIPSTALQNRQYPPFEAVLLIGDPALRHLDSTEYSVDLGEVWYKLTGLPFVYACWVAREEACLGNLPQVLLQSKTRGIAQSQKSRKLRHRSSVYLKHSASTICKIGSNMISTNLQSLALRCFISLP